MALETATYIDGLVVTNPPSSDQKSQGDDHLRLLKSTIKATFPNITGAVNPTHTELNHVDGVTSPIQTQLDAKLGLSGGTVTGTLTITGTLNGGPTAVLGAMSGLSLAISGGGSFGAAVTGVTATTGDSSTKYATTEFVTSTSFTTNLPGQLGNAYKFLQTDGTNASWGYTNVDAALVALGTI